MKTRTRYWYIGEKTWKFPMGGVKTRKNIKYTHEMWARKILQFVTRALNFLTAPMLWISLPRREIMWSATLLRSVSSPLLKSIVGLVTPRAALRLWDVYPGGINAQIKERISYLVCVSLKQRQPWPGHPSRCSARNGVFSACNARTQSLKNFGECCPDVGRIGGVLAGPSWPRQCVYPISCFPGKACQWKTQFSIT